MTDTKTNDPSFESHKALIVGVQRKNWKKPRKCLTIFEMAHLRFVVINSNCCTKLMSENKQRLYKL